MKNRKEKNLEYQQKYADIPRDYNDRLSWMASNYHLSESAMKEIIERRNNIIQNIEFQDFFVVLYMEPEGTPRHRYRLITPKNYMQAALNSPYVHIYQPRAQEDHTYLKKLVSSEIIQLERFIQTPFACNINAFFKTPTGYSRSDTFMAEIGLDFNIKKPDVDNIEKKYLDMFNENIWLDDNMCFSGRLNKFYSVLPRVEISIRYMNCAMNKYQYNHIVSRVGYQENSDLYYLDKLGNPNYSGRKE
jgi:Holliday junction resolvase RusA-like endonuclease